MDASDFLFFWHPDIRRCGFESAIMSQWFPAEFVISGIKFSNAEQYMMYRKAVQFDDICSAKRILDTKQPAVAKRLGRNVKNYDDDTWVQVRTGVVRQGNNAKFMQNPPLIKALQSTRERIIAEASPHDLVWGIGIKEDHPNACHPHLWKGQNLLGKVLMDIRKE